MNILYVYAHPRKASFNAAARDVAIKVLSGEHEVQVSDLYEDQFNPVVSWADFTDERADALQYMDAQGQAFKLDAMSDDLKRETDKLKWADLVIFQFPFWWYGMPAIMKGWLDRVFFNGVAYDYSHTYDKGLLKGKKAMLVVTTSGGPSAYEPGSRKGDIHQLLKPITTSFKFTGLEALPSIVLYHVGDQAAAALETYQKALKHRIETCAETV
jgi:NAD(P)H dehydrogenase (quinone)